MKKEIISGELFSFSINASIQPHTFSEENDALRRASDVDGELVHVNAPSGVIFPPSLAFVHSFVNDDDSTLWISERKYLTDALFQPSFSPLSSQVF